MGQVLIRNLDDQVIDGLKARARTKGMSLETFLRDILTAAAPLTADEKVAMARAFQVDLKWPDDLDVGLAIRMGRDDEDEYRAWLDAEKAKKAPAA